MEWSPRSIQWALGLERIKQWRVTLPPGVLEAARNTAVPAIAAAVRHTLEDEYRLGEFPARIATRGVEADWFVSAAAADFDGSKELLQRSR